MATKGHDIAERLLSFAAQILLLIKLLPQDVVGKHVARQIVRSATGSGANYEEARGAESRADFVHKVSVASKEARETHYWLKLIERAELIPENDISQLIQEANELVAILTSSARTAKHR
jgi:four helix bundle protein